MNTKLVGITVLSLALTGVGSIARADHASTRITTEVSPGLEASLTLRDGQSKEHMHVDLRGPEGMRRLKAMLEAERRKNDVLEQKLAEANARASAAERSVEPLRDRARVAEARANAAEVEAARAERSVAPMRDRIRQLEAELNAAKAKADTADVYARRWREAEARANAAESRAQYADDLARKLREAEARANAAEARANTLEPMVRRVRDLEAKLNAAESRAEAAERRVAVLERLLKRERDDDRVHPHTHARR